MQVWHKPPSRGDGEDAAVLRTAGDRREQRPGLHTVASYDGGGLQASQELATKDAAQDLYRQKEIRS